MTSGKTEVGRQLAARLGWSHLDLDQEIERAAGCTIEELFATRGEAAFRALEAEHTPRALERGETILSPGGGWITNPGLFETLSADTLSVWLKVSGAEVVRRLSGVAGQPVRPLLQGPDPEARIAALLAERTPLYQRAALRVDTDGATVEEVVAQLEAIIRGTVPIPLRSEV